MATIEKRCKPPCKASTTQSVHEPHPLACIAVSLKKPPGFQTRGAIDPLSPPGSYASAINFY